MLVRPKEVEEITPGGIIRPDQTRDREQGGEQEGELIELSPGAFTFEKFPDECLPKPGDTLLFAKYAGVKVDGVDGVEYRIINDKDIIAKVG